MRKGSEQGLLLILHHGWCNPYDSHTMEGLKCHKKQMDSRPRARDSFHSLSSLIPVSFICSLIEVIPPLFIPGCTHTYTTYIYVSFPFCLCVWNRKQNRNGICHLHRKSKYQFILTVQRKANTAWNPLSFMWKKMSKIWLPPIGWINQRGRHACVSVIHRLS